jgi:hypothetical protein
VRGQWSLPSVPGGTGKIAYAIIHAKEFVYGNIAS